MSRSVPLWSVVCLLTLFVSPKQQVLGQSCGDGIGAYVSFSPTAVSVGGIVTIDLVEVYSSLNSCTITNGRLWVIYPDGTAVLWLDNITLVPNSSIVCPGEGSCFPGGPLTYMVKPNDIMRNISFQTNFPSGYRNGCGNLGQPDQIQFAVVLCANAETDPPSAMSICQTYSIKVNNPRFTSIKSVGPSLVLSGLNGPPNQAYIVVTAADPTSLTWVPVWTNSFGPEGQFTFTYPVNPNEPQRYFRVLLP